MHGPGGANLANFIGTTLLKIISKRLLSRLSWTGTATKPALSRFEAVIAAITREFT